MELHSSGKYCLGNFFAMRSSALPNLIRDNTRRFYQNFLDWLIFFQLDCAIWCNRLLFIYKKRSIKQFFSLQNSSSTVHHVQWFWCQSCAIFIKNFWLTPFEIFIHSKLARMVLKLPRMPKPNNYGWWQVILSFVSDKDCELSQLEERRSH